MNILKNETRIRLQCFIFTMIFVYMVSERIIIFEVFPTKFTVYSSFVLIFMHSSHVNI